MGALHFAFAMGKEINEKWLRQRCLGT